MSQTKAQLIAPVGIVTTQGVVVTGVMTATSFDGDVVGSATSIISGSNLNLGTVTATASIGFGGDFTGTATGIQTGAAIKVGVFTATSFTGDFTGTATSMMRGTGFEAGTVTSTAANVTYTITVGSKTGGGNAFYIDGVEAPVITLYPGATYTFDQADSTNGTHPLRLATAADAAGSTEYTDGVTVNGTQGTAGAYTRIVVSRTAPTPLYYYCSNHGGMGNSINITNQLQGNVTGNVTGSITGLAGSVTSGGNIHIGVITATSYYGDGSNLTGIAATNFNTQVVTANGSETIIDLADGNCITMNQSANTTVGFASTSTAMDITIIRKKDDNSTARTITWPDSVKWTGGTAPTLINSAESTDFQQFQFITRDAGLTWYAWENTVYSPPYIGLFSWGFNNGGNLGLNSVQPSGAVSSPTQVGTDADWGYNAGRQGVLRSGAYSFNMQKADSTWWGMGVNRFNELAFPAPIFAPMAGNWPHGASSPTQMFGGETDWVNVQNNQRFGAGIKSDGTLWTMGRGTEGQLGQNNTTNRSSPVQVPGTTWYDFGMGYAHMFAKKTDGTLWSWGTNTMGQLGLNNQTQYSSPKQVGGATWGTDRDTQGMKGTTGSTYVVDASGNLWSWGQNVFGNLGHNNQTQYSSPRQVPGTWTTLSHNTYAHIVQGRKSDGTLWFWGTNGGGSVPSPGDHRSSPTQQGTSTNWALGKHDASNQGSGGVDTSGNLYRWGQNQYGNLGDNSTTAAPASFTKQVPGTWKNMRLSWDATIATKEP